jgi:dGTP triphosphohydrolase
MQTKSILTSLTLCLFTVAFTACDKKPAVETPATATPPATAMDTAKDFAGKAADAAKDVATKTVDTAKDLAAKTADTAKDAAAKAVDAGKGMAASALAATDGAKDSATGQFTTAVAGVKKCIADNNYKGAVDELKKFSSLQLSAEQSKIVDGLKAEVQKLMPASANSALDAASQLLKK